MSRPKKLAKAPVETAHSSGPEELVVERPLSTRNEVESGREHAKAAAWSPRMLYAYRPSR